MQKTEEALKLLTISYEDGLISFTGVFVMQAELVSALDQLAQTRGDVVTSLISLYKALGGGWEIRYGIRRGPGELVAFEDMVIEEPVDDLPPLPVVEN